jgi:hypothetical protein
VALLDHSDSATVECDAHQRCDCIDRTCAVIFAYCDQAIARRIDERVGIALLRIEGQLCGCARCIDPVKLLIAVVAEHEAVRQHCKCAAAVFVRASSHIERRGVHIGCCAICMPMHDHVAALFLRATFAPENIGAAQSDLSEANGRAGDQVCGDG